MLLLIAALLAFQDAPADPGDEIVVVARPQGCKAFLQGEALSSRRLDRYAQEWKSGIPIRIRAPRKADYRCLAKIAFKLSERGIRLIRFVGP